MALPVSMSAAVGHASPVVAQTADPHSLSVATGMVWTWWDVLLPAGLFVLAIALALAAHYAVERWLHRLTAHRRPGLYRVVTRTRAVTRLAFILLALHIVLPSLPLSDDWNTFAHDCLFAGFIILAGWVVLVAVTLATDRYAARFRLDVDDNLAARKYITQMRVLRRIAEGAIILITAALALMVFPVVREVGVSLFASAGVAGLIVGLAARPVFENLLAGVQIALTQPIRIDDVVVINGQQGRVEEITASYVVVKLWDYRRLIVPLSCIISSPFENWTRTAANLLTAATINLDYTAPVAAIRAEAERIVRASKLWAGDTLAVQVTNFSEQTMEMRILASARMSSEAFDLRCEIREKLIAFIQENYPQALPRSRSEQRPVQPDIIYPTEPARRAVRPHAKAEAAE